MSSNVPYFPPITQVLPEDPFDLVINTYGIRLTWMKAHSCPCTFSGPTMGTPNPACLTCQGRGIYWDNPSSPFIGLITWVHVARTPDEPGFFTNEKVGIVQHGEPTLTLPYKADSTGTIWGQASVFDAYVEIDSITRYNANLQVGGIQALPYQHGLTIAPSGAVTIFDPTSSMVQSVAGYTVSGATVLLPDVYPPNTAYNVEFTAQPVYVAFDRAGGAPHVRPFGLATPNAGFLPRRFRLQALDLWSRARQFPGSSSPQGLR